MALIFAVTAVACAVGGWLAWTGRWQAWARQVLVFTLPIHGLPGFSLLAGFAAAAEFSGREPGPEAMIVILPAFALIIIYFLGIFLRVPEWSTPQWYRDTDLSDPDLNDPLTALIVARSTPVPESSPTFPDEPSHFRWHANWIYDPSPDAPLANAAAVGFGAIAGRLAGHPSGLDFQATKDERRLADPAHWVLTLPKHELRAVHTVPPRAGPNGERPYIPLMRRLQRPEPRRRLVVTVADGVILFAMYGSRKRADQIAEYYGIERRPDV